MLLTCVVASLTPSGTRCRFERSEYIVETAVADGAELFDRAVATVHPHLEQLGFRLEGRRSDGALWVRSEGRLAWVQLDLDHGSPHLYLEQGGRRSPLFVRTSQSLETDLIRLFGKERVRVVVRWPWRRLRRVA